MYAETILPGTTFFNYRIISQGLFQPIIQLSVLKQSRNIITGTADLTIKEPGREAHRHYKIRGHYTASAKENNVLLSIWGYDTQQQAYDYSLLIKIELNKDWTTGVADYQYPKKNISKATVCSILFTPTQIKPSNSTSMQPATT